MLIIVILYLIQKVIFLDISELFIPIYIRIYVLFVIKISKEKMFYQYIKKKLNVKNHIIKSSLSIRQSYP